MDEDATDFPEGPKLEFELLLSQLIARAEDLRTTQVRLRNLIQATNSVVSDLDLSTVLARFVEVARELVSAEYAAMGVIGEDGELERFIHVGMDEPTVKKIGHPPEGRGLLGALFRDSPPIRLREISGDERSSGFPAHHPPMESFLGVTIRLRDEVYGNLYLTNQVNGEFSADDEELVQALAASAGIAIANARLFEETRRQELWSTALAETNRRMLANDDETGLQYLIERIIELADADLVCVLLAARGGDHLVVDRAVGPSAASLLQSTIPLEGSVVQGVLADRSARITGKEHDHAADGFLDLLTVGSVLLIPFEVGALEQGVLAIARTPGRNAFQSRDLALTSSLADQVTLCVQRSRSHVDQKRMQILEDRSRIAKDLHDHVIQRLFAAGLSLQAVASGLGPGEASQRIVGQISDIDETIAQIRQSIFALKSEGRHSSSGLRARVRETVERVSSQLPTSPTVRFLGPVDLMSDDEVADDVVAVVTEALANAVRHSAATSVTVTVNVSAGRLALDIIDDGKGLGGQTHLSGLANMRDRALRRGGYFSAENARPKGTHVIWCVPV